MGWNPPPIRATDYIYTAASFQQDVTDNLLWLGRDKPHARVQRTTAQSVANNTNVIVLFDAEQIDVGSMHSTVTNTGRITIPAGGAGFYMVGATIEFAAAATGVRDLTLRLNGSLPITSQREEGQTAGASTRLSTTTGIQLNAGDYIEAVAYQNSGGALDVTVGVNPPTFWATWVVT